MTEGLYPEPPFSVPQGLPSRLTKGQISVWALSLDQNSFNRGLHLSPLSETLVSSGTKTRTTSSGTKTRTIICVEETVPNCYTAQGLELSRHRARGSSLNAAH